MAYQPTRLNGETVFRNEVFQTGLMSQLLDGVYDGEMTIGELLSHGNFGVGTFNGLDGEMVVLDGACYQVSPGFDRSDPVRCGYEFCPHD